MSILTSHRRKRTGNHIVVASLFILEGILLTGCGDKEKYLTSISIDKEGIVTNSIYEEFDQNYYDISELSDMASQEISYYNSEYISPKITLDETQLLEDGTVAKLVMTFDSASDYGHFNQTTLFYGTVNEASEKGFTLSGELVDEDGARIDLGSKDFSDRHIIISGDRTRIIAPFNIEYMTKGVTAHGKKEADLTNVSADSVQLLLSK
nr:hypothetical protein [uncultured Butyrivibrio sp.]